MRISTFPARAVPAATTCNPTAIAATLAAGVILSLTSTALAQNVLGPEWVEQGDAGSLPTGAQVVTGQGQVQRISGMLGGLSTLTGAGDFEDMYRIRIANPTLFSIRTDPGSQGFATFDTQLWVFDLEGFGILGNDDTQPSEGEGSLGDSAIFQFSTDGTESGIFEPGEYLICISGAGNRPTSTPSLAGTAPQIFFFNPKTPFEISGPDGPGGAFPVTGWAPDGATGTYSIALTGVDFIVPAPGTLALLGLGLFGARARRRRA